MQDKYGKSNLLASESIPQKTESQNAPPAQLPQQRRNEVKRSPMPTTRSPPHKSEASKSPQPSPTSQEQLEKLRKNQIQWCTPPGTSMLFLFVRLLCYMLHVLYIGRKVEIVLDCSPNFTFILGIRFNQIMVLSFSFYRFDCFCFGCKTKCENAIGVVCDNSSTS